MHRSRIGVVLIDHAEAHDEALAFWAAVTGGTPTPEELPEYTTVAVVGSLTLSLQRLGAGTPSRVHLDVETDDVAAEVRRLVGLGATLVEEHEEWTVLADPGGLPLCVVPVQDAARFETDARTWPGA